MGPIFLLLWAMAGQSTDALLSATRAGDIDAVRARLEAGTDVNGTDADGRTALILAASLNHQLLVEFLLEAGASPTHRDADGISALTAAKAAGAPEIIALLRAAGASESPEELLDEAIRAGDLDAVTTLIDESVDINALDTGDYQTPLMTALELRELEIFLRLVQAGANPTIEGGGVRTTGENAISLAARQGSPWALRLLLETRPRQADLNRALLLGCANTAIISVALEAGAKVNAKGRRNETPLICAASAGSADAVAALLKAGADPTATTTDGQTARDWAERKGFEEVATLLAR